MQGKWILITGASKGLGRAMALTFAEAGASLILNARSAGLLEEVKAAVEACGVECECVAGDVTDDAVIETLAALAVEWDLDVLVNNAGIVDIRPLEDVPDQRVRDVIELNMVAPILLTKALTPHFKARRAGAIVNINSGGGRKPGLHHTIYCASKFGLYGFAETLRLEFKPLGVRILNVHPGKMATQLFNAAGKEMDISQFIPPKDIAGVILRLLRMPPQCGPAEIAIDRMSS